MAAKPWALTTPADDILKNAVPASMRDTKEHVFASAGFYAEQQDTPDDTIAIYEGVVYMGTTKVEYDGLDIVDLGTGGAFETTAMTADYYNIILFSINSSGTLTATEGTAHAVLATVTLPAIPAGHFPICLVSVQDDGTGTAGTILSIEQSEILQLHNRMGLGLVDNSTAAAITISAGGVATLVNEPIISAFTASRVLVSSATKEVASSSITTTILNFLSTLSSNVQTQINACVKDTGNAFIGGVKTFSSSPIVPTPTTDMQAATKKYMDDNLFYDACIIFSHTLATTVDGGTFTQDAWQTRPMNTEDSDLQSIGSISSNQMTITAGTYVVSGFSGVYQVGNSQSRLRDTVNNTTLALGSAGKTDANNTTTFNSVLSDVVVIQSNTVLELQHYCGNTVSDDGFGKASDAGESEVFAQLKFERLV